MFPNSEYDINMFSTMFKILDRNCRIYFENKINCYNQYFYSNFIIKNNVITINYLFVNHTGIIQSHYKEISYDMLYEYIKLHEDDYLRPKDNRYHFSINKFIARSYIIFSDETKVCEIDDISYYNVRQFVIWLNKNGCGACFDFKNYHKLLKEAGIDF